MGAIFGGMLLAGKKVAETLIAELKETEMGTGAQNQQVDGTRP